MSVVRELSDHCFVEAAELMRSLVVLFEEEVGRKPTVSELCEVLTWAARSCRDNILEGTPNQDIVIQGEAKVAKQRMKVGDLICVPVTVALFGPILYIGKCGRFGHAFGIFDGAYPLSKLNGGWEPLGNRRYPVFADERLVSNGSWIIVSSRPDLIGVFGEPSVFYHPTEDRGLGTHLPHGLVENAKGEVRKLSAEENREVFEDLPRQNLQGLFLSEELEAYLRDRIAKCQRREGR